MPYLTDFVHNGYTFGASVSSAVIVCSHKKYIAVYCYFEIQNLLEIQSNLHCVELVKEWERKGHFSGV
jgi:hypothetical protein